MAVADGLCLITHLWARHGITEAACQASVQQLIAAAEKYVSAGHLDDFKFHTEVPKDPQRHPRILMASCSRLFSSLAEFDFPLLDLG